MANGGAAAASAMSETSIVFELFSRSSSTERMRKTAFGRVHEHAEASEVHAVTAVSDAMQAGDSDCKESQKVS